MDHLEARQEMCKIGKSLWLRNYCAGNEGNLSMRLPNNQILCTPTGVSKGDLVPEELSVVTNQGELILGPLRPSSELKMHLEVYRRRPDIQAVVHAHPKYTLTLAIAQQPLPVAIYPEAELFLGEIPLIAYSPLGSEALAMSLGEAIVEDTSAILMGNHGATTFANSLRQAYYNMEILESYCQVLIQCKQFGNYHLLSMDEMMDLQMTKHKLGLTQSTQWPFDQSEVNLRALQFFGFSPL
jgi:L-fuculose-phosphate aldolase